MPYNILQPFYGFQQNRVANNPSVSWRQTSQSYGSNHKTPIHAWHNPQKPGPRNSVTTFPTIRQTDYDSRNHMTRAPIHSLGHGHMKTKRLPVHSTFNQIHQQPLDTTNSNRVPIYPTPFVQILRIDENGFPASDHFYSGYFGFRNYNNPAAQIDTDSKGKYAITISSWI